MEEIWKKVEDNPSYEVSNNNGFRNITKNKQPYGRINKGYRIVGLGKNVGEKPYHILVAKAFPEICGKWYEGCHVHHINFNKLDNKPENLIILSQTEHTALHYKYQSDKFKKPSEERSKAISKALKGKPRYNYRIPILQYTKDGVFIKEWEGVSIIEKETGIWASNITKVCKGKLKQTGGFIWKYKRDAA